jgi:hypothetical protein
MKSHFFNDGVKSLEISWRGTFGFAPVAEIQQTSWVPLSIGCGVYSVRKDRSAPWAAFGLAFYRLGALMSAFRTLTVLSNASSRTIDYRPRNRPGMAKTRHRKTKACFTLI